MFYFIFAFILSVIFFFSANKEFIYKIASMNRKDIFLKNNFKKIIIEFFSFIGIYILFIIILFTLIGLPIIIKRGFDCNERFTELSKEYLIDSNESDNRIRVFQSIGGNLCFIL